MSSLDATYAYNRSDPQDVQAQLPDQVLGELMHNFSLAPFWDANLCRPWHRTVVATDASPSFGFGVAAARAPVGVVKTIGRNSHASDTYIRLLRQSNDPPEKPRDGIEIRIPLKQTDFGTKLSVKAAHIDHSGGMEAHAVALGLRWLTRDVSSHETRVTFLVDAKAVVGALRKGRTSAHTLKRALRRCAAIAVAADLLMHVAYVPSESNPSDWASRGLQKRRATSRSNNLVNKCGKFVKRRVNRCELALKRFVSQRQRLAELLGSDGSDLSTESEVSCM